MTDKEKMTEIIQKVLTRDVNTIERKAERMTNALIGAGFVSDETRHKRNVQAIVRAQESIKVIEYARVHAVNACNYAFHRAEVAERAFDNTMKVFHEILSAIFPDTKIDLNEWKKNNLANAEKELAERKNEEKKRT